MRLSIIHERIPPLAIDLPFRIRGVDEIAILEHLGEEKRVLEVIKRAACDAVDVGDFREPGPCPAGRVDGAEGMPGVLK